MIIKMIKKLLKIKHNYLIVWEVLLDNDKTIKGSWVMPRESCSSKNILDMEDFLKFKYDAKYAYITNVVKLDD